MMKQLQEAGYFTSLFGKTHFWGLTRPMIKEDEVYDLREYDELIQRFGFDVAVEEFDRYVHAFPNVLTHYTEYLKSKGVYEEFAAQIRAMTPGTPQHWDGVTSPLDQEDDLTSYIGNHSIDWLKSYCRESEYLN